MQKKILIGLLCLHLSSFTSGQGISLDGITAENCGTSNSSSPRKGKILGGAEAYDGQFPWMVSIQVNNGNNFKHHCGGSILNENWIVTAAHCIPHWNKPSMYQAAVGLHKMSMSNAESVQRIGISEIFVHDEYDTTTYKNDIALMKMSSPINIAESGGHVNGVCLPRSDEDPTGLVTVAGWGHTTDGGESSDTLREVSVPMVPRDKCNKAYDSIRADKSDRVTATMICAGETDMDACQADSGGPLIQKDSEGVSTLVGIVSHGYGCGVEGFPGIYTKVSSYMLWMERLMSGN